MNSEQQLGEVVRYWWSKAEESLTSAKRELEAGAFDFAINRVYYAVFYAVTAAFLERHLSFSKHAGVRAAFHREFIKTGLLGIQWGKFYDRLFEDRQEGDYIALVSFDRGYVEEQIALCKQFHMEFKPLIVSLKNS